MTTKDSAAGLLRAALVKIQHKTDIALRTKSKDVSDWADFIIEIRGCADDAITAHLSQTGDADGQRVAVPVELLKRVSDSLGSFVSDEGWKQSDMDVMDSVDALLASKQESENG